MSDSPKLAHTICLILQSIGIVYLGELEDECPALPWANSVQLAIAAFSQPLSNPAAIPPMLRWFGSNSSAPLLVIADQPIDRAALNRPTRFLKYPFDAQTLCDHVTAIFQQSGSQKAGA